MSWRWIFWFNLPLGLLTMLIFAWRFPEQTPHTPRQPFDWVGALLLLTGLTLLMTTLAAGQAVLWPLALLALGLLALFARRQQRVAQPLIHPHLLHSPTIVTALGLALLTNIAMFTALTYVPLFVQEVMRRSPSQAGLVLTPMMVAWPLASAAAGLRVNRHGFRRLVVLGAVLLLAGLSCWAALDLARQPLWLVAGCSALLGCGMGLMTSMLIITVQVVVPPQEIGSVSAILNLARNLGSAGGVSALGALQVTLAATLGLAESLHLLFVLLWGVGLLSVWLALKMPDSTPLQLAQQHRTEALVRETPSLGDEGVS